MKTAVIYVRQSRHKEYERTVSPEVQLEACTNLKSVSQCDRVEVFEDLDVSGGAIKGRHGYVAMLERIRGGGVAVVAAYDQSRTFRNTADALSFYSLVEKRPDIDVEFVLGSFDRTPSGEFTYTALAAAHAMERRMLAKKVHDAYQYKAARGLMVGAPPAGYRRLADGTATIVPEVAELIHGIFVDYSHGKTSVRRMASRLNAEGVPFLATTRPWRGDTIAQILTNIAYVGRTYTESRRYRRGTEIAGRWPPIIEVPLWEAVQRQLEVQRGSGLGRRLNNRRDYVFERLLRCTCGRKMHSHRPKAGGTAYYRCPGDDAGVPCHHFVREDELVPWATDFFRRLECLPRAKRERMIRPDPSELPSQTIRDLEERMGRLGLRFEWGHINEESYRAEWARLEKARLELVTVRRRPRPLRLKGMAAVWESGDRVARHDLLSRLFDELDVEDRRIVGVKLRADRLTEVARLVEAAYSATNSVVGPAEYTHGPSVRRV